MSVCAFQLPIEEALSYLSVRLRLRKFCRSIKILQVRWIQGDIFHKGPPQQCSWISIKKILYLIFTILMYFTSFNIIRITNKRKNIKPTCASGIGISWDVAFVDNSIESFSLSFLMAITIFKHCIVYPKVNFKVQ